MKGGTLWTAAALSFLLQTSCLDSFTSPESDLTTGTHTDIVERLVAIVAQTPGLGDRIQNVLAQQGESSFWHGQDIDYLYDYFDAWLTFLPTPADARRYMDPFYDFSSSEEGRAVVLEEPVRNWLLEFMMARGEFMDSEASAAVLPWWLTDPDVAIEDYIIPPGGFKSFNEFFIREIRPETRPIAAPGDNTVLTAPADATAMLLSNDLSRETVLRVKGDDLSINELLGGDELADSFIGGRAVLFMLATTNYHRFHAPVAGDIVSQEQLAGLYYGMTGGWVDYFFQHRRGYFLFSTEEFGLVGMVSVGMFTISSIEFTKGEGDRAEKGEDLGHFAYGGSAIILLFEPGRSELTIPIQSAPMKVLMGQEVASVPSPATPG